MSHPLALALIERVNTGTVLELGTGNGGTFAALSAAGLGVSSLDCADYIRIPAGNGSFDAVISTHGLLHGNRATISVTLAEISRVLRPGGLLYAAFGSKQDARFGLGVRIDQDTFAQETGDEAGVPHLFSDGQDVRELLSGFTIEMLTEQNVDSIAGDWAHQRAPLAGAVHWFVTAINNPL